MTMIKSKAADKSNFTRRNRLFFHNRDSICIRTKSYFKDGRCKQSHTLQEATM